MAVAVPYLVVSVTVTGSSDAWAVEKHEINSAAAASAKHSRFRTTRMAEAAITGPYRTTTPRAVSTRPA